MRTFLFVVATLLSASAIAWAHPGSHPGVGGFITGFEHVLSSMTNVWPMSLGGILLVIGGRRRRRRIRGIIWGGLLMYTATQVTPDLFGLGVLAGSLLLVLPGYLLGRQITTVGKPTGAVSA